MQTLNRASATFTILFAGHTLAQGYSYSPPYWCRGFNQTSNYTQSYAAPSQYSHRISEAVICNSTNAITGRGDKNGTCVLDAGGFFETKSHTNVSSAYDFQWAGTDGTGNYTYDTANSVLFSVYNLTDESFNYGTTFFAGTKNTTYHIPEGENAYVAFTPVYQCLSGWLSKCPSELDLNGVYVEACNPIYTGEVIDTNGGLAMYEGSSTVVQVNKSSAANLTGNPNERPPQGLHSSDAGLVRVGSLGTAICGIAVMLMLI